jgi:hypothetical protein
LLFFLGRQLALVVAVAVGRGAAGAPGANRGQSRLRGGEFAGGATEIEVELDALQSQQLLARADVGAMLDENAFHDSVGRGEQVTSHLRLERALSLDGKIGFDERETAHQRRARNQENADADGAARQVRLDAGQGFQQRQEGQVMFGGALERDLAMLRELANGAPYLRRLDLSMQPFGNQYADGRRGRA